VEGDDRFDEEGDVRDTGRLDFVGPSDPVGVGIGEKVEGGVGVGMRTDLDDDSVGSFCGNIDSGKADGGTDIEIGLDALTVHVHPVGIGVIEPDTSVTVASGVDECPSSLAKGDELIGALFGRPGGHFSFIGSPVFVSYDHI